MRITTRRVDTLTIEEMALLGAAAQADAVWCIHGDSGWMHWQTCIQLQRFGLLTPTIQHKPPIADGLRGLGWRISDLGRQALDELIARALANVPPRAA